jgi:Domain of unknown function (DUF4340)
VITLNENTKTGIFAIVALTSALGWWITGPRVSSGDVKGPQELVGKPLFEKYEPSSASSLKIVKYDDGLAKFKTFEVGRDKNGGAWSIPSHDGYPADASKQMSDAANLFIGITAIGIQSQDREDQKLYGVVEPNPETLEAGTEGVGMLVRMQDTNGENLVNLIIGKTVKDKPNLHFVRKPNEDVIYVAEIETSVLSTDFKNWIEADLLKLSSTDIDTVSIRDYTVLQSVEGGALSAQLIHAFDADLKYTVADGKWVPQSIKVYQENKPADRVLAESEQLNTTKLNETKNTLDSLRIANVKRKPNGLAANLKADKSLLADNESIISLFNRGFVPQKSTTDDSTEIFASSGELIVTLTDGVQYLLRFGNKDTTSSGSSETKTEGEAVDDLALDRYLLVSTRLDESRFPPPELKPLPETIEDLKKLDAAAMPVAPAQQAPQGDAPPAENPGEPAADQPAAPGASEPGTPPTETPAADSTPSTTEPPAAADPAAPGTPDQPKDGGGQARVTRDGNVLVSFQPPAEEPATTAAPENQPPAAEGAAQPPETAPPAVETEAELKERLEATREKITKDNQRLIDSRNERLDAAKKKVDELNARFAEWYYLISEAEYKKLHIGLTDLIQPKSAGSATPSPGFNAPPGFNLPGQ